MGHQVTYQLPEPARPREFPLSELPPGRIGVITGSPTDLMRGIPIRRHPNGRAEGICGNPLACDAYTVRELQPGESVRIGADGKASLEGTVEPAPVELGVEIPVSKLEPGRLAVLTACPNGVYIGTVVESRDNYHTGREIRHIGSPNLYCYADTSGSPSRCRPLPPGTKVTITVGK